MIKGESVTIYTPSATYDENKDEVFTFTAETVDNVLFGRPTTEQMDEVMRLYSVEVAYTLGIPKTYDKSLRGCYVVRARDVGEVSGATGATGETGQQQAVEPPKYWIAGDPQPLPLENCPTPWNREAYAVIVDG